MKTLIHLIVVLGALAVLAPAMSAQDDLLLDQTHAGKKAKAKTPAPAAGPIRSSATASSPSIIVTNK